MITRVRLVDDMAQVVWSATPYRVPWRQAKNSSLIGLRTKELITEMGVVLPVAVEALLAPFEALHQPLEKKLYAQECCEGSCGHGSSHLEHCPPVATRVCWHCYEMGDRTEDGWETYFAQTVQYPCPTRRLCDEIRAELVGGAS